MIARLARAGTIEAMRQDFVRTARAKGLPERQVVWKHALRPALLPVVSYLGPAAAGILTGSFVVETLFGVPGMGQWFVKGAINRDYPVVLGTALFYFGLVSLFNLAVDLAYAWLDPRSGAGERVSADVGGAGPWRLAWRRLRRNRAAVLGALLPARDRSAACFVLPLLVALDPTPREPALRHRAALGRALARHRRARARPARARADRRPHLAAGRPRRHARLGGDRRGRGAASRGSPAARWTRR